MSLSGLENHDVAGRRYTLDAAIAERLGAGVDHGEHIGVVGVTGVGVTHETRGQQFHAGQAR